MSWRDRLQRASFRGVEFRVEAHSSGSQRRLVVHEFPGIDAKLVQDLGRGVDVIRMRAYVIGEDYDRERDRLLAACQQRGPGTLVHPYLGELEVRCSEFRVEERTRVGGVAQLSLAFIEAGRTTEGIFPSTLAPRVEAERSAEEVQVAAAAGFQETLEQVENRGRFAQDIAGELRQAATFIRTLPLRGPVADVARFQRQVTGLADSALDLVAAPSDLADSVRDVIVGLGSAVESRTARLEFLLELLEQSPARPAGPVTSIFGRDGSRLARATSDLIRSLAAAQAVVAASEVEWEFLEQAEDALQRLRTGVDDVTDTVGDEVYTALRGLLSAAAGVMPTEPEALPSIERVTLSRTVPAVVLAYQRFGTRSRDEELVARNPSTVRHPGRLPGGATLEVLSQ